MRFGSKTPCENCRNLRQGHLSGFMSLRHRRHTREPLKAEADPVLGPIEQEYWGTHVAPPSTHPPMVDEPLREDELERELVPV